jgi:hypothetical protein
MSCASSADLPFEPQISEHSYGEEITLDIEKIYDELAIGDGYAFRGYSVDNGKTIKEKKITVTMDKDREVILGFIAIIPSRY